MATATAAAVCGYGGGIYCGGGSPTISSNTITGNGTDDEGFYGDARGGGIYCGGGSPAISNNTITGNSICGDGYGYGGGICSDSGSPAISNNTITGNSADDAGYYGGCSGGCGGGICCYSYSDDSPAISNNTITGNSANGYLAISGSGGGIYCYSGFPAISNNTITGNTAYCNGGDPFGVYGCGGGIYCAAGSPTISNNTVTGNNAFGNGGNDSSDYGYGGGIYCYSGSPTISNNTITGNSAFGIGSGCGYGGGIYCGSGSPFAVAVAGTVSGNTFTENSDGSSDCDGEICVTTDSAAGLSGTACDAFGAITSVNWSNSTGGGGACTGTTSWSVTGVALQPGDNVITVTATDMWANTGTAVITIAATSAGVARQLAANTPIYINAVVTATAIDSAGVTVESADRSSGIELITSQPLTVGQNVSFTGTTNRVAGEIPNRQCDLCGLLRRQPLGSAWHDNQDHRQRLDGNTQLLRD